MRLPELLQEVRAVGWDTRGRARTVLLHAAQGDGRRECAEGAEGRHGGRLQQERRAPAQRPGDHAPEDVPLPGV